MATSSVKKGLVETDECQKHRLITPPCAPSYSFIWMLLRWGSVRGAKVRRLKEKKKKKRAEKNIWSDTLHPWRMQNGLWRERWHREKTGRMQQDRWVRRAKTHLTGQKQENTDSQKVRHYKDSECTRYAGEETNVYGTNNGEIWHRTKGVEPEGFFFAPTWQKWTAKMASKSIKATFLNQPKTMLSISALPFILYLLKVCDIEQQPWKPLVFGERKFPKS